MSERPYRPAAASKCSASWECKVQTELFELPRGRPVKPEKKGRWDPYDRFHKKKHLTRFYSGHKYRRHLLRDREDFAKFAIKETLKGHPDDIFDLTGDILQHESIIHQLKDPGALEGLESVASAGVQQDVDAEIPRDRFTQSPKADETDVVPQMNAAVQSIISASPNSLGPPIDPSASYLRMTKCGQYGRNNSTVWRSPFLPKLNNEGKNRGLFDHQVTAITWLLSRMFGRLPKLKYRSSTGESRTNMENSFDTENCARLKGPKYFGGILADSMGLGKTLITVALVDLLMSQKLNVVRDSAGNRKYRPVLLITPNATVASQWVGELRDVISDSTLRHIVVSVPGFVAPPYQNRVISICRESFGSWARIVNYMWDENNPNSARVILIVSMESWAARTCKRKGEEGEWYSTFTEKGRRFSLVIVDEAYKVKNARAKAWKSVYLLDRSFTLLITATPCMNTLTDLLGLARLLWTAPEAYLRQNPEKWSRIKRAFKDVRDLAILENHPLDNDFQLVAAWPALLSKLLCKPKKAGIQKIGMIRKYLKYFERLAMLKRSPSSYIYVDWERNMSVSLKGLLPKVKNYTVDIDAGQAHYRQYQRVHTDLLIKYLEGLKDWENELERVERTEKDTMKGEKKDVKKESSEGDKEEGIPIVSPKRLLQIAAASLDVYDLDTIIRENKHSTSAGKVAEMRENRVNLLHLAQFLVLPKEPSPATHVGWMKIATRNSPILRYILHYICENILTRKENEPIKKLLIIEDNVMIAFYYESVLQFLGFKCRCLHAKLSYNERQDLIDSFNDNDLHSCQILIQMYTVGFAGSNLHKSCSRVLVAAQSYSLQVQWQAIHRVIRVGQDSDVTVHRVKLKNSYHSYQESRQIDKILPELSARAQGDTQDTLVQLLNLFHYEVQEAWLSPEGRKLMKEKSLLDDIDEEDEEDEDKETEDSAAPAHKKVKLNDGASYEVKEEVVEVKVEDDPSNDSLALGFSDGFSDISLDDGFLNFLTRDEYYEEFIDLPSIEKSYFNPTKNNLRRLLSYGNDIGKLSTAPWARDDLEQPAVLERAFELILRVRLGAKDIAMLPLPLIDFSQAPASRRRRLQSLLADINGRKLLDHGNAGSAAANKDILETLGGIDVKMTVKEIDRELELQARFGDLGSGFVWRSDSEDEDEDEDDDDDDEDDDNDDEDDDNDDDDDENE
ncbi:P-loop containing nucleoside triphosphate hydrolase protein [Xylaria palmicola]|nr:P-loop containing nucleoside triphosphate hydrolase protein [Xylaria palmicola]